MRIKMKPPTEVVSCGPMQIHVAAAPERNTGGRSLLNRRKYASDNSAVGETKSKNSWILLSNVSYIHIVVSFEVQVFLVAISVVLVYACLLVRLFLFNVMYFHSINKLKQKNSIHHHFKRSHYVTDCVIGTNGSASHNCNVKSLDAHSKHFVECTLGIED